jgi:hypothetical protein
MEYAFQFVKHTETQMSDVEGGRMFLTGMELLRLDNCATSTRLGQVDQGFPNTMAILESKGLVKKQDLGYVVTGLGIETLRLYSKELKVL